MDRRDFVQTAAALAAGTFAQRASAAPAQAPGKFRIDAYSRHLQWLRSPNEVAEAVREMTYDGLDITVRPYPGHVDPEKVQAELPPFVNAIRANGLSVRTITCPITDADSPNAERILDTAASLGIHHYWWGTFRYDQTKPVMPQLEALKPRVEKLAALNRKYGMKAMYHTYSGPGTVGSAVWDLLEVLRNFDPRYVSFHWDSGHMTNAGGNDTWALNLRAAAPYIGGVSMKDSLFERASATQQGEPGQGGPPPGGPGGPGAPGGGPQGRGGGRPRAWVIRQTPLGMGQVDLPLVGQVLKEIGFDGPVEVQSEYPNGGANNAADKLTLPRAEVLGAMKRDLLVLRQAWAPLGLV